MRGPPPPHGLRHGHPVGTTTGHTATLDPAVMTSSHTPKDAARRASLSTFVGGLSAWLGGIAFCVGFGVSAPAWMALVLTVLSLAAGGLSRKVLRRST